jgi:CheY-like chemotaxis protein
MNHGTILVVDDSMTVLKALEVTLQGRGFRTVTATDGSEALKRAGEVHPDLVIMDVNLPPDISQGGVVWDGFRVIEWMRYTGAAGTAPAIIITSDDLEQHKSRALEAGAVAVFQKPISIPELLETISECLEQSPQTRT